jgi:hypothetical protein
VPCRTPGNNYGPDELTEWSPLAVAFFRWRVPDAPARSNAGRGSRFANDRTSRNVGNATYVC